MIKRRRRFRQTSSLEDRLTLQACSLRAEAKGLPPGQDKELLLRRARQHEAAIDIVEWLTPEHQPAG